MLRENSKLDERTYDIAHIHQVAADMQRNFAAYFASFAPDRKQLIEQCKQAVDDFKKEQPKYQLLLDAETLEEYAYDPNSFKSALRAKCPIILRCLNSPAKVMDNYRAAYYQTSGKKLLEVTTAINEFGHSFMNTFQSSRHMRAQNPAELGVSALDEEQHTAYGVIGGGIRSHLLYQLYPEAFPNRSQSAIWAYYFLSERKDYGMVGGSEFLMIEDVGAQQNYFYPYDLFLYYANQLFLQLDAACTAAPYGLASGYRYVYLNTFLNHIADAHHRDINIIKPQHEQLDY